MPAIVTSASTPGYLTPNAFAKKINKKAISALGWSIMKTTPEDPGSLSEGYEKKLFKEGDYCWKWTGVKEDCLVGKIVNRDGLWNNLHVNTDKIIAYHKKVNPSTISESAYSAYKEQEGSPKRKIHTSIKDMHESLKAIEKSLEVVQRFKTESGINSEEYFSYTKKRLNRIQEKLTQLTNKLKGLME